MFDKALFVFCLILLAGCGNNGNPTIECDSIAALGEGSAFVFIPKGEFIKSESAVYPEEGRPHLVSVDAFLIQSHEVTNQQFSEFVSDTAYVTDAEQRRVRAEENGSAVFSSDSSGAEPAWRLEASASWRTPLGKISTILDSQNLPVVHVSLRDTRAYAAWAGGRLPTELEWEYAAQLGLTDPKRPDSGAYDSNAKPIANTWQGVFPMVNTVEDGFRGASPVACFPPSEIGLYDMMGNVWEWTDTPVSKSSHLIKGGSFLCANNFCKRYRPTARQVQEIDFSTNHLGFRIVKEFTESSSD